MPIPIGPSGLPIVIKRRQGDRYPSVVATLVDGNGDAVDLTTASSVSFRMGKKGRTAKVNASATVTDAANGEVTYSWGASDLSEAGQFDADFVVSWSASNDEHFPSERGQLQVLVTTEIT